MAQNVQNDVVRTIFKNKGWCGRAETGIRSPPRHYPNPPTLRQTTSLSLFGTTLLKPKLSSRRGSDESCLLLRGQISTVRVRGDSFLDCTNPPGKRLKTSSASK